MTQGSRSRGSPIAVPGVAGNYEPLVPFGQQEPSVGVAGWETDRVGQLHHQQSSRDPVALLVGDDLCVRAVRQLRGLRWAG